MGELITSVDSYPLWKSVIWCFYPIITLIALELISSTFNDDDDDQGGGMMIPAYQGSQG
tara:strand:- start:9536 stop:9712 length:177 start_codon:yes stop_codon:yes gene_type:complete